jgi:hypothetical protein
VVAVTFFSTLCNAQDDAVAAPTGGVSTAGVSMGGRFHGRAFPWAGVSMGYAAQGNVAMSKARHEAELERAALAACQQKALKGAMAFYAQTPPITGPSTMSGRAALPERKPGLFDFLKSKKIAAATVDPTLPCTSSARQACRASLGAVMGAQGGWTFLSTCCASNRLRLQHRWPQIRCAHKDWHRGKNDFYTVIRRFLAAMSQLSPVRVFPRITLAS